MLSRNNYIDTVIGNYRIITGLANSESSSIYMAQHTAIPKVTVAIKVFHNTPARNRDLFFREVRLLRMLKHPHILPMLDAGTFEDDLYLISEYAPQGSLRERIQRQGTSLFPVPEVISILSQVGQALTYAHHFNIVHGNLKPENILFSSTGHILLADFGWTTMSGPAWMQGGPGDSVSLQALNSARYMAPEQFQGFTSRRSDQYALGCVVYELFTRQVPFSASDFASLQRMHTTEEPAAPTQFNLLLSPRIEGGILKALARRSEDRHPNIESFIASLSPASAVPAAPLQKTPANGYLPIQPAKIAEIMQVEKRARNNRGMLAQPGQEPAAFIEAPAQTSGEKEKTTGQDAALTIATWPQVPEELPKSTQEDAGAEAAPHTSSEGVHEEILVPDSYSVQASSQQETEQASANAEDIPAPVLAQEIARVEPPVPVEAAEQEDISLSADVPDIEASTPGEQSEFAASQVLPIEAQTTAHMGTAPVEPPAMAVSALANIETYQFIPVGMPQETPGAPIPVLQPAQSVVDFPAHTTGGTRPAGGFVGKSGQSAGSQRKRLPWLVALAWVAAIVTLLAFILPPALSSKTATISARPTATRAPAPTPIPTLVPTPTARPIPKSIPPRPPRPTPTPSPTPKPTATPVPGVLTASPTQINANTGCSGGNGNFRCSVTVSLPANARTPVSWVTSSSNVVAFFNPSNGMLNPGSQQQVSIHVYSSCPNTGAALVFSTNQRNVSVLWSC
ncbi:MAG: protein kinase [Chloroflexota bacterium]|nr:protein kinase [Chloroflexota bacterium]